MVSEAELNESMTEETATQKKPVPPAPQPIQSQILQDRYAPVYLAPRSCPDHDEDNHARRDTGVVYSGIQPEAQAHFRYASCTDCP